MTGVQRPRRVLVNAVAARTGGGGTVVVSQLGALAPRDELDLTVVARGEVADQLERIAGLRVQRPPARSLVWRLLWEHLVLAARSRQYDVLYCTGNFALPLARGPQVVAMLNALLFGAAARRARSRFPRRGRARLRLEAALARVSVRRATAVITISESLRSAIEEDLGPRPCVRAIRCATPILPPPRPSPRSVPYVLGVANDYPHKDWDALVATFAAHRDLPPLVAVGRFTAARRSRLERAARGRVRFAGTVTTAELADLYGGAACCVVHSWVEAFGLTALEALSCGTAVIASDIPAHREVCRDRAVYYDPADMTALAQIVRTLVARESRDHAAARADRAWTWDDNAREVAAVLVAAGRSGRFDDGP